MPEIHELSALELRAAYDSRSLSPIEVVEALFDRIDLLEPSLHAFITQTRDAAAVQAGVAAREWRVRESEEPPPLLGIPVTIKDLVDVQGVPTTMGSLVTSRQPAARDELFVERLRAAGAVFLGKTNTSEFGLAAQTMNRIGAPTANPWNLDRTAGGSSGGAAAACAAGLRPAASRHRRRRLGPRARGLLRCGRDQAKRQADSAQSARCRHVANLHRRRPRPDAEGRRVDAQRDRG